MHKYEFTSETDWFSMHVPLWQEYVLPLAGNPIRALEIGSFEGRSAIWLLENVLTHPASHLTCIDPFEGSMEHEGKEYHYREIEERFHHNLLATGKRKQVTHFRSPSQSILPRLLAKSFDFIYIDGSHRASDVLQDAVLSWLLLRNNGLLIFDDYALAEGESDWDRPTMAIDAFLHVYQGQYSLLENRAQVIIRKGKTHG